MKITDVKTIILRMPELRMEADGSQDAIIIKVFTDEGIIGIGEVDSSPHVIRSIINTPSSHIYARGLKEILVGEDPLEIEKLWKKMYDLSLYFGRRGAGIHAISGIDIALWDIAGKYYNQPVYKLLGAHYRDKIEGYASVLMPGDTGEVKAIIDNFINSGYKTIKFGYGALGENKKKDILLVKTAREAMGEDNNLAIDIGFKYEDVHYAIEMANEFEKYNVFWMEEPLFPDDMYGYAKLTAETNLRIAYGEQLTTYHEFDLLLNQTDMDVIQPDISRCGGITEARKIGFLANYKNVKLVPHHFSTGILLAASLHFLTTLPDGDLMEFCNSGSPLSKDLLLKPIEFENGFLKLPDAPGLGIELNEEIINKYQQN